MSRSFTDKKTYVTPRRNSEKGDKRDWHKRLRRLSKEQLASDPEGISPCENDAGNPWHFNKDGKWLFWVKDGTKKERSK